MNNVTDGRICSVMPRPTPRSAARSWRLAIVADDVPVLNRQVRGAVEVGVRGYPRAMTSCTSVSAD